MKKESINIFSSLQKFIHQEKSGGIILGISVILAVIITNSPFSETYFNFFNKKFGFFFNNTIYLNYDLYHWINDGLMAIFFFVVGLELKREFIGGELANPRKALLPIAAAIGGMIVPASIYILFNNNDETIHGWGIPMATDIAFALSILYLLGNRVSLTLKIFLAALAIVDDLGAVLVIAIFYTSEISFIHLFIGIFFLFILLLGNKLGVKNILFYTILGVLGVWLPFLLSGVHATVAAVLVSFTIPAQTRIKESSYIEKIKNYLSLFKKSDKKDKNPILKEEQLDILEKIENTTKNTIPVLQSLEYKLHPFVTFLVIPIFAFANSGIKLDFQWNQLFSTPVFFGVFFGLLVGKPLGIIGFTLLTAKLKIAPLPAEMNLKNLVGLGFIASIGFTMSIFINSLAFTHEIYISQAKIGIFSASIIGGIIGYLILSTLSTKKKNS